MYKEKSEQTKQKNNDDSQRKYYLEKQLQDRLAHFSKYTKDDTRNNIFANNNLEKPKTSKITQTKKNKDIENDKKKVGEKKTENPFIKRGSISNNSNISNEIAKSIEKTIRQEVFDNRDIYKNKFKRTLMKQGIVLGLVTGEKTQTEKIPKIFNNFQSYNKK